MMYRCRNKDADETSRPITAFGYIPEIYQYFDITLQETTYYLGPMLGREGSLYLSKASIITEISNRARLNGDYKKDNNNN